MGCGTSTGVPVPGCCCSVCCSDDVRDNRLRTSSVLETKNGELMLLDASPDLRTQVLRAGVKKIDAVLFTHSHADHVLGVEDLRPFTFGGEGPLPCYADADTASDIRNMFRYIFSPNPEHDGGALANLELVEIKHGVTFKLLGASVTPFPLQHGRTVVTGYRINDFGYATDCNFIPEESLEILRGVDILFLDGLRFTPEHRTHFTIPQAMEMARRIGARETYFIHLTHSVSYAKHSRDLPPNMHLAYDGLQVTLS